MCLRGVRVCLRGGEGVFAGGEGVFAGRVEGGGLEESCHLREV